MASFQFNGELAAAVEAGDVNIATSVEQRLEAFLANEAGDITGITAGLGISGGGTSGTVTVAFAPSELSTATVATDDKIVIADTNDSDNPKTVTVSSVVALAPQGDITAVTAGTALTGGGSSGDVTLNFAPSELSSVTVATDDKVVIADTNDSDNPKTVTAQSIANLASASPAGGDHDVQFNDNGSFGGTSNFTYDGSAATLKATLTVGENGTGKDVKLYGDTADAYLLWDESDNDLRFYGAAELDFAGTTAGADNRQILFAENYEINADNTGTGSDSTRLWFGGPDGGDFWIGPRGGSDSFNLVTFRADLVDCLFNLEVNGSAFFADKVQTGQTSFTATPWSNSVIALGSYGTVGTQGSYRTTLGWNYSRTSSGYAHLDINSYPQAGSFDIGNSGFLFNYDPDMETNLAFPPTVANIDTIGQVVSTKGGADGGIVLGQTFSTGYVGLRTAGMSSTSGNEYMIMSNGNHTLISAGTSGDVYIRGGGNDQTPSIFLDTSENEIVYQGDLRPNGGYSLGTAANPFYDVNYNGWLRIRTNSNGIYWQGNAAGLQGTATGIMMYGSNKRFYLKSGNATQPSLTFIGDSDTGIWHSTNVVRVSTGGTQRTLWSSAGTYLVTPTASSTYLHTLYRNYSTGYINIYSSSERFKKDIVDMPKSQWEKIYDLRPVRFNWDKDSDIWIPDENDVEDHGLIAEEVNEVFPKMITKTPLDQDEDGNMIGEGIISGVNYEMLTPYLVAAVKDIHERVNTLESQ